MNNFLLIILISLTLISCSESSNFGGVEELSNGYSIISDDIVLHVDEPREEFFGDSSDDPLIEDTNNLEINDITCKIDIKMTSAHESKVAVHLRDSSTINTLINNLEASHQQFINNSISGQIPYSENIISQTVINNDLKLNVKGNVKVKATSVHVDEVIIYASGLADIQFTSLKAKHLVIVASSSIRLKATSFDVENVSILVKQDESIDQNICVRETSAGSLDLSLGAPINGSGLIISGGTSFKGTIIKSLVIGDGSAAQVWKATSIKESEFLIVNQVSGRSRTSLQMTSLNQSSVKIEELSSEANVLVKATRIKGSSFVVDNMSSGGTHIKTSINGCGDFRDGDFFLANLGAQEDIGVQCN